MVNHGVLLEKLLAYGVRGQAWNWISSYLEGRSQRVVLTLDGQSYSSNRRIVETGVPQGSILGPLLFIIFMNDVACSVTSGMLTLYADDMTAVTLGKDIPTLGAQTVECVEQVEDFSRSSGLLLNTTKTDLLVFSVRRHDCCLYIRSGGGTVKQNEVTKFLGVTVDSLLSWGSHIDLILKKLALSHYVVWQLRYKVERSILISYYHAYVGLSVIWGGCLEKCGSCRGEPHKKRFCELWLLNVIDIHVVNSFKLKILTIISVYIL